MARYAIAMTKPTDDQLASLGAAFETFTRRYKLAEAIGPDKPLNELDRQTLFYVADHPACGPTDVARFLGTANSTISSATDRLVKRGLLKRARVEQDRRAVALDLTDDGHSYVTVQRKTNLDMRRLMLERLTPEQRDQFIALITQIVNDEH